MDPLSELRRIAFAGDWHANHRFGVAAIEYARERGADVVVHVGDFGYWFAPEFVASLTGALRDADMTLLFVDGNHENFNELHRYPVRPDGLRQVSPRIFHIPRGHRWTWGGLRFLGCGGAHSVDRQWREPGVSWWPEERLTQADVLECARGGPADVLVAHDCPAGVDIPGLNGHGWPAEEIRQAEGHRETLREVVDACQPRLIVHGHYHRNYRAEVDFGYGRAFVRGLGMDGGDFDENLWIVDLAEVKELVDG